MGTVYGCGESLTTPLGQFEAWERGLSWRGHADNGPRIGLDYPILLDPFQPDDRLDTFTGLTDRPELWVFFDDRFVRWKGRDREPRFMEARIGDFVMREDLRGGVTAWSQAEPTSKLLAQEGDLGLKLLDGGGAVLQQGAAPRSTLLVVEETLLGLQARVIANLADKEHRCRLVPEYIVFVN